jgi:hypothetical protein
MFTVASVPLVHTRAVEEGHASVPSLRQIPSQTRYGNVTWQSGEV